MLSMTRWNPLAELNGLHREMDRVFGRYFDGPEDPPARPAWTPATEITSDKEGWTLRMALPGVEPKEVDIDLHGNSLTISGERTSATRDGGHRVSELGYGRFERVFALPSNVDAEKVAASYANGMLELTLPLAETAKPRRIAIG